MKFKNFTYYFVFILILSLQQYCYAIEPFILSGYPAQDLPAFAKYLPENPIIIEAGSFDGADSVKMSQFWPKATIHSFEPVPETYQRLLNNTRNLSNVYTYQLALSDSIGYSSMFISDKPNAPQLHSLSSSLLPPKEHLNYDNSRFDKQISVPTITLDLWATLNKIQSIDFLWLDLQGCTLKVLKASPVMLKTVKVVLTEIEFVEAFEGQELFEEIKTWFKQEGFELVGYHRHWQWFGDAFFVRKELL